jgi:hypothetical protein
MVDNVKNPAWAELSGPKLIHRSFPFALQFGVRMTAAGSRCAHARKTPSLHLDDCSRLSELLLDVLRLFLGDAFLDRLGRTIHQVLGFL